MTELHASRAAPRRAPSSSAKPSRGVVSARAPIRLANRFDRVLVALHRRMSRLAARERFGEHVPRLRGELGGKFVDRLDLALELEAVSTPRAGAARAARACCPDRRSARLSGDRRVLAQRDRTGPACPRSTRADCRTCRRSSAARRRSAPQLPHTLVFETRASSPLAVCSSITSVERHELREQLLERAQRRPRPRSASARGSGKPDAAIHARHAERRVLDRLHERAAPLGPSLDALFVEEVARQAVHLAHASPRTRYASA